MNPIDQLIDQYKRGYKTTELWVAMAAGLAQALSAAFVPGAPLNKQLTNLTWVGIAYILARSGLKIAQVTAQARVSSPAPVVQPSPVVLHPSTNGSNGATVGQPVADAESAGLNDGIDRLRALAALVDSGALTQQEFARAARALT